MIALVQEVWNDRVWAARPMRRLDDLVPAESRLPHPEGPAPASPAGREDVCR